MIANASQVRFPCESPVPSRPVPSLFLGNGGLHSHRYQGSAPRRPAAHQPPMQKTINRGAL